MSLGLDPALFWDVTPSEGEAIADGAISRLTREHNDRAWLAHTTARLMHFHHQPRKTPSLRTLLIPDPHARRRRQSSAEQLNIVKALHAAFNAPRQSRKRT